MKEIYTMDIKDLVVDSLKPVIGNQLSEEETRQLIETPSNSQFGDLAFPTFTLAKIYKKSPPNIAEELVKEMDISQFEKVETVGPYINFFVKRSQLTEYVLEKIMTEGNQYGRTDIGKGQKVPIDMSSPNIAKPMSMGHLRSTVIGNSLALILEKIGYEPIRINHLGDWGTQFGKLIVAYREWGDEEVVEKNPVQELVKLYVEFHERAEFDPSLEERGRQAFKQLEEGEEETIELWRWFKEESIKEFEKVYHMLGIEFDTYTGESFYNDKMQEVIDELADKGISELEGGATIVQLDEEGLPPALIKKSDGASLYLTRDLATAYYRYRTYQFAKSLYVVGNEQSNHFKQLKAILKRLGREWADDMHHIPFGLITIEGKKLSTRKGKIVLLESVLDEAIVIARQQIEQKNPDLINKEQVAFDVGVGAVVFHDLKTDRMNIFDFKLEDIVQFEGETGPYVQYTHARCCSILERVDNNENLVVSYDLENDYEWDIIKLLARYNEVVLQASEKYEPSIIAKYVINLAQLFNKFYGNVRILDENAQKTLRIMLVKAVSIVLKDGLRLLGMKAPDQM